MALKFYKPSELASELKEYTEDAIFYVHVFPFYDTDIHKVYTYLCDRKSAVALILAFPPQSRFTYKLHYL